VDYIVAFSSKKAEEFVKQAQDRSALLHVQLKFLVLGFALFMLTVGGATAYWVMKSLYKRDMLLRQANDNLRIAATVFESQEGMFITDTNSIILRVNPAFTRITGYSAEEALGKTPRLIKSGQQDKAFYASMWESLNREGYWAGEILNRRKSGEVYPEQLTITTVKDASGIVTNYVATLTDVTERKQVELLVSNSQQQLNFVLESSNLGFWDWHIPTGVVERNHIWAEMLGYTYEEIKLTTNQWADFVHPDDIENAWKSINDALEGRTSSHEMVYRMRTKSG
jgi:PAS domain S-box-containing protein